MEFSELKEQIGATPLKTRAELDTMLAYTSIGDNVLEQYRPALEQASTYREFFDAIFADDAFRFTPVWAKWARFSNKRWLERFQPVIHKEKLRLKAAGLPVEFEGGVVLAPAGAHDNIVNFFVFEQHAFNTEAADFVTSVGGTFTCADFEFKGIYGIYKHRNNIIFEAWQEEEPPKVAPQL